MSNTSDEEFCVEETMRHIRKVREHLGWAVLHLQKRATEHDQSKLQDPELPVFVKFTPKLRDSTYGSEEYRGFLQEMQPALVHHYANNRHHPEHHADGVDGMTLIDLLEMLCDWKAATQRHANGDIVKSIEINTARFNLSPQLASILRNTVQELWPT